MSLPVSLLPNDSPAPRSPRPSARALWDALDRPDSAALHGLLSGAAWFLIAVLLGLLASEELVMPDIFGGVPFLVYSRVRPAHVNMVLFGFLSTAMFGGWYFIVPRLCKTPLWTNRAANILLLLWNAGVVIGTAALLNGDTQGKEYTEYPWYADYLIESLMIANAVIIFGTILRRREPKLYVSLWYVGGSVVWIAILYAIGSVLWHPLTTFYDAAGHLHFVLNNAATLSLPDGAYGLQRTGSIVGPGRRRVELVLRAQRLWPVSSRRAASASFIIWCPKSPSGPCIRTP